MNDTKQKSPEQHMADVESSSNVRMKPLGEIRKTHNGRWQILVKCPECGKECWVDKWALLNGQKSCGCVKRNPLGRGKAKPKPTVTVSKAMATIVANHLTDKWKGWLDMTPKEFEALRAQTVELYYALRSIKDNHEGDSK